MNFSTRQNINRLIGGGGTLSPLLIVIVLGVGLIGFMPSGVINLREQETIFPIVAMILLGACLIYFKASTPVGLAVVFALFYSLANFTPDNYKFILTLAVFSGAYYVIVTSYSEIERRIPLIFNVVCILALLNVLWLALQVNGIYIFFHPVKSVPEIETGFFANRNEVSVFLAASLPFFFRGRWHYGIIPVLAGLCVAQTTNGIIGAALVLAIYGARIVYYKGWPIFLIAACAVCGVVIAVVSYTTFIHSGAYGARMQAFTKSIELVQEKPFLGWGISQGKYVIPLYLNGDRQDKRYLAYAYSKIVHHQDFKRVYLNHPERYKGGSEQWNYLHNDYLQWTIEAGVLGLFLMLLVIGSHVRAFLKTKKKDIILGLSGLCLLWTANAFFTFQIGRFAFLTVIIMALIQGRYLKEKLEA